MFSVKRISGTHYFPHLKCSLKVSTLPLVLTCGLLPGTTHYALRARHYALRRSQHKLNSRIISPTQHSCSCTAYRKITLFQLRCTIGDFNARIAQELNQQSTYDVIRRYCCRQWSSDEECLNFNAVQVCRSIQTFRKHAITEILTSRCFCEDNSVYPEDGGSIPSKLVPTWELRHYENSQDTPALRASHNGLKTYTSVIWPRLTDWLTDWRRNSNTHADRKTEI